MALDKSTENRQLPGTGSDARTVLVLDDSRAQRMILSRLLSQQGYHVLEAGSGEAALEICATHMPDLILSDWMMPGMDGLEFCRKFRAMQRESYGYFILLTSKDAKDDATQGFDAGADDFLTKPVNAAELRARIRAGERVLTMEQELHDKNALVKTTLDELQAVYDSINSDLIEARKLQESLVSDRYRDFGAAEVSLMLRSSGHVGGDLVGMFPVDGHSIGIYGIDVSGHGISSALMTARLAGYLSATAPDQNIALTERRKGVYKARCPAETVRLLNDRILSEIETEHYFTLILAILDMQDGTLRFAQAGHPCPMIQRASGQVESVGNGGLPVGLINGAEFDVYSETLSPGDRFLIHSDGITECTDFSDVMFGDEGLRHSLIRHASLSGHDCLQALVADVVAFSGYDDFDDDVSSALVEFKGQAETG